MKKLFEFLKAHKYSIIWTICYIFCMYLILWYLFKFDMFSSAYWRHLIRSELRGFPGFVFGILVLSALPVYIATTTLIIRTKKPLITIPVPSFIKTLWSHMQPTLINQPAPEQSEDTAPKEKKSESDELPSELPSELRTAYIRARMNLTPEQSSAFNQPTPVAVPAYAPTTDIKTPDEIPLPTDFDIDIQPDDTDNLSDTDFSQIAVPTFSDINFDNTPSTDNSNALTDFLDAQSIKHEVKNDLVITNKHVIASHTDSDFWICDDDNWFATGKQRTSPIPELLNIASEKNLQPILYLGATNIMDLDNTRQTWEQLGIKVITSPNELFE